MRIHPSDERDSTWERSHPRFRVYFFRGGEESASWSVDTYDIEGADVLDTVAWAEDEIGDGGLYAVALVEAPVPGSEHGGITWLVGMDANSRPHDDHERALLARMKDRRGKIVIGARSGGTPESGPGLTLLWMSRG